MTADIRAQLPYGAPVCLLSPVPTRPPPSPALQLLFGNLALHGVSSIKGPSDEAKADRLVHVAYQHFSRTLKSDPHNVFAASGLAACLAVMGEFSEAQRALTQVTSPLLRAQVHSTCFLLRLAPSPDAFEKPSRPEPRKHSAPRGTSSRERQRPASSTGSQARR